MLKALKKHGRTALLCTLVACTTLSISAGTLSAGGITMTGTYQTVTEVKDWGPAVTKVIVDVGRLIPAKSVAVDTFKVHVVRSDKRLENPLLEEGDRKVTKSYVSDKEGKAANEGRYVVLEMEIGPSVTLSSAMNFSMSSYLNDWIESKYTITQQKDIITSSGKISGFVADTSAGGVRELVDDFGAGKASYDGVSLTYADYSPEKDRKKNPLIIWLHGMGEGGTDPTLAIAGNKAVNFAARQIQSYFDGAYVLAPQTPTYWMQGSTGGFGDGTSKYEDALMKLIQEYVSVNKDIDPSRIYIGGDSNGGYMTMLMIRDYPELFAAAFPTCEALKDSLITDADIQSMKDLPIWFIAAKTDTTVPVDQYVVPTYNRLIKAGANNVHLSLFDRVTDTSGLYKNADGKPYEYNGHWSWIYVYNNQVSEKINGKKTTLMTWLASQSLNK